MLQDCSKRKIQNVSRKVVVDALNDVFRYATAFTRSFRKGTIEEDGQQHMAALLTATLAFAKLLKIDFFAALWEKFPGVCAYCRKEQCSCAFLTKKPDRDEVALVHFRVQHNRCPTTVRGWQQLMRRLYGAANAQLSEIEVLMRVVEEVWEMSVELEASNYAGVSDELADVFARTLGFCTKLGFDAEDLLKETTDIACSTRR